MKYYNYKDIRLFIIGKGCYFTSFLNQIDSFHISYRASKGGGEKGERKQIEGSAVKSVRLAREKVEQNVTRFSA